MQSYILGTQISIDKDAGSVVTTDNFWCRVENDFITQDCGNVLRRRAKIFYKSRRNPFLCSWELWRPKQGIEYSIIIINYCIIINAYYIYIINSWNNYYIRNKGFLEECDKEENVAVTGAATASYLERRL